MLLTLDSLLPFIEIADQHRWFWEEKPSWLKFIPFPLHIALRFQFYIHREDPLIHRQLSRLLTASSLYSDRLLSQSFNFRRQLFKKSLTPGSCLVFVWGYSECMLCSVKYSLPCWFDWWLPILLYRVDSHWYSAQKLLPAPDTLSLLY